MSLATGILVLAVGYALIWTVYVVTLPIYGRLLARTARPRSVQRNHNSVAQLAIIVPAKDMAEKIERCVNSILASDYPHESLGIFVIADHCNDNTDDIARACGAEVLVRNDGPAGKTFTLAWTFEQLQQREIVADLYVIVDATAYVEPSFLSALVALWCEGEDIIVSHPVVDSSNQKWFARCLGLTLVHRNLQNRARQQLRLSALIEGRGMAYSRKYVSKHGWSLAQPKGINTGSHPTEDWRHGVQAVEHGYRVAFADDARVVTPLRDSLAAATQQGVRWERGRMANAATHALRVLLRGLRERDRTKVFAALDAIQPPVAILGAFATLVAIVGAIFHPSALLGIASLVPLLLVVLYGVSVVLQGRRDGIEATAVFWAPVYIAWRCSSFLLAWGFLDRLNLPGARKGDRKMGTNSEPESQD